jgi:hypothetical protein
MALQRSGLTPAKRPTEHQHAAGGDPTAGDPDGNARPKSALLNYKCGDKND